MGFAEKFMTRFSNDRKLRRVILILAAAALILLALSEIIDLGGVSGKNQSDAEYASALEHRIIGLLERLDGVGKAEVMVTVNSSPTQSDAGIFTAKTQQVSYSDIRGVVIICEGGGNPVTVQRITQAVCVAFDIGYNKVFITEMNSD